ncbi:AraC family transcriptional regulator [Echinicola jeungdonensis]|uniref:Helix-turn-helix domain-containing protein n=1 Tax=Echinicola jeungdonensis TaxID=709343 RepID=A0ABV5J736_9BACT|nr:AraC family transcriptional regulator [Echinicola jeungdonensis]MDN3670717.1 AraC family transcriptional regulator [Echinicola jeungdonensis]
MVVSLLDFVHNNSLFKQFKVDDLLLVEYKCIVDETKLKIWSEHNYFIYVVSGKKIWHTIHSKYEVLSGQAIFVKKGANIVHQFFDKNFCSLIIFMPDNFISDVIKNCDTPLSYQRNKRKPSDSIIPLQPNPNLNLYFQSVFAFFKNKASPPPSLLKLKFKELILIIISSGGNDLLSDYLMSLCEENKTSIREIMEHNFIYNMKLEEFARLSGRSLTSFKRDFMATFKTTPGKWLTQKKLEHARHLLETTDKNINELTFESGFENSSHFIRKFKQVYQTTPLKYRKKFFSRSEYFNS